MHKKLEAELVKLANSILEMKNNEEIATLHKKAQEIYEKLTVLKFVESNLSAAVSGKEEAPEAVEEEIVEKKFDEVIEEEIIEKVEETPFFEQEIMVEKPIETNFEETVEIEEVANLTEENEEDVFSIQDDLEEDKTDKISSLPHSLKEEFENAISADVATNLFERATKEEPTIKQTAEPTAEPVTEQVIEEVEQVEEKKVSLNDSLFKDNIQVGLNDRIAFVKHLFEGSQEDFNRVISQLNSFDTEKEAKGFLRKFVKPDYNWTDKAEYEDRLIALIERKFL